MASDGAEDPGKLFKFCRICAKEKGDLVRSTQTYENGGSKSTLREIFNDCSPVKITNGDGLPDKFCLLCLGELLKAYEFRLKCCKSYNNLTAKARNQKRQSLKRDLERSTEEPSSSKICKSTDYENCIVKTEIICAQLSDDEDDDSDSKGETYDMEEDEDYDPTLPRRVKLDTKSKKIVSSVKASEKQGDAKGFQASRDKCTTGESSHPDLGDFKITILRGYKNSSHVVYEANGFLYVNTRNTAHRRYLRCSTSRACPGKACIDIKPDNEMEEYMYTYKLHNHPKETLHITKLKFLEEVRTIAASGNFTPRQLYGKAIAKFPELYDIMPYSTLTSRLYRLSMCTNPQTQSIDTLKKFAQHLMRGRPMTYCVTKSGEQFFQEALIDDDANSCSLIYANTEVIESMSFSNEIFVDSSFKVSFERSLDLHFLTICISVNEHRLPIFFALMDTVNQYEYTKVLNLFKDKYASSLHPEAIITDFDASLFKALNEVYKHSTITGSLVHYIFKVYKQCNVEDIVKEIERKAEYSKMQSNIFSLPILPPELIPAGLRHLMHEANESGAAEVFAPIFSYIQRVWIDTVTPHVFSLFSSSNGVNENIVSTYKRMRDIMTTSKKLGFFEFNEKLLLIEEWVSLTYHKILYGEKIARQIALSKYEKVLDKLWQPNYIEKNGFDNFFSWTIPLMEKLTTLIWVWGFYDYNGQNDELLISPEDFYGTQCVEQVEQVAGETIMQYSDVIVEEDEQNAEEEEKGEENEGIAYEEIIDQDNSQIIEVQQTEGQDGQVITLQFINEAEAADAKNE